MRILVVDDQEDVQVGMRILLEVAGHEVLTAHDGAQALTLLEQSSSADVVITDLLMPYMDGFELCRKIKLSPRLRHIPVIFHTASYVDERDMQFAREIGASSYLIKPVDPGELLHVLESLPESYLTDEGEDQTEIFRSHRDVMSRKLEQNRGLLLGVIDAVPAMISVKDLDHRYILMNRNQAEVFGVSPYESRGKTTSEYLPINSELAQADLEIENNVIESGEKTAPYEQTIETAEGKTNSYLTTKIPLLNNQRQVSCVISVDMDITEIKATQNELASAKTLMDRIFSSLGDALLMVSPDTVKITSCNNATEKIFGYTEGELIGKTPEVLHFEKSTYLNFIEELPSSNDNSNGGEYITQYKMKCKDGAYIWTEHRVTEVCDEKHVRIGWVCLIRDITEKRKLEEQLNQALKMEALGHLTGGIAHDFHNTLGVILGNAEMLGIGFPDGNSYIDAILHSVEQGSQMTQRLLAFSRKQPLNPKNLDIAELLDGMKSFLQLSLGDSIGLEISVAEDIGFVRADSGQLESSLLNLTINAQHAMPEGGEIKIEAQNAIVDDGTQLHGLAPGKYIRLSIKDSGVGMTQRVLDSVFEPFFTTKEVGEGSGLGLSMVYGFAKQSNGGLYLTSTLGEGTEVRLYLPQAVGISPVIPVQQNSGEIGSLSNGKEILVIEDNEELANIIKIHLERLDYQVHLASEAESAFRILENSKHIDLILSDIQLQGGVSGIEVARKALLNNPELEFVFMSGYTDEDISEGIESVSSWGILQKPFKLRELSQLLSNVIESRD